MKTQTILILGAMAALALLVIRRASAAPANAAAQSVYHGMSGDFSIAPDGQMQFVGPAGGDIFHPGGQLTL